MGTLLLLRRAAKRLIKRIKANPSQAATLIARQTPVVAELIRRGLVSSHIRAIRETVAPVGITRAGGSPPPPLPITMLNGDDGTRFPGLDASVEYLRSRQLITTDQLKTLETEARQAAFTVARLASQDAIRDVRDALVDDIRDGGTLVQFQARVADAVKGSGLGPAAIETIYRANVGHARAAGQRAILSHPLVADEFPYLLWSATHDGRVREDHLAMEKHGQNGTAVYRADDPVWKTLYPPCDWGCRCGVIPLSIKDAAKHGSLEAQRWLETGVPPAVPDWAATPYPVIQSEDWPTHDGIQAVV